MNLFVITFTYLLAGFVSANRYIIESKIPIEGTELIMKYRKGNDIYIQICDNCNVTADTVTTASNNIINRNDIINVEEDIIIPAPTVYKTELIDAEVVSPKIVIDSLSMNTTYHQVLSNRYLWGLDSLDNSLDSVYNYNYLAENVIVYVVDTGIYDDPDHFQDRVKGGISFVSDPSVLDCNGHGTHVTSIIASTYYGVAKNVTIIPVRIFGCDGGTPVSTVVKAINWILQQHQNSTDSTKAVINMSNSGGYSQALNNAMQAAFNAGFVVVAAAGNDAHDSCLNSPASTKSIITVGCYNKSGQVCSFSNQGSCVDIFAPGELILGLFPDSVPIVISGTSMSAPHVSGVIAIMKSVYKNKTPAQLRNILVGIASAGKLSGFVIKNTANLKLLSLQSKLCQYSSMMNRCKKDKLCLWNRKSRYCYLKF